PLDGIMGTRIKSEVAFTALLLTVAALLVGCNKQSETVEALPEPEATSSASSAPSAKYSDIISSAPEPLSPELQAELDRLRAATERAATNPPTTNKALNARTKALLDTEKELCDKRRWSEAAKPLNQLAELK